MRRLHLLFMTALVLTCNTGTAAKDAGNPLGDTAWVLAEMPGQVVAQERAPTLRLENGRAHGSDGCNRFTAAYHADGERFQITGDIASTRMACPDPVMRLAEAFVGALAQARSGRIQSGRLVLADVDGNVLATLAPQTQELAGTSWQVTAYNNGRQAVVSVLGDSVLTVQFAADGRIGGSAGCNRYTGTYISSGSAISIAQLGATRKLCTDPEKVMEQELAFLEALHSAATVRVEGDRLELRTTEDAIAVWAIRAEGAAQGVR